MGVFDYQPRRLGGFTPAAGDAILSSMLFNPSNPNAAAKAAVTPQVSSAPAGTAAPYIGAPAQTVASDFKAKVASGLTDPTSVPSGVGVPEMPQTMEMPQPLGSDVISGAFAPLLAQMNAQKAPAPRDVPPPSPALATFLSALAGSLGTQFAKDPAIEQHVFGVMHENEVRRQAIQDQNYADKLQFDQQSANRRYSLMGQMIETQLQQAIQNNDVKQAAYYNQQLEKIRGQMEARTAVLREKAAGEADVEKARATAEVQKKGSAQKTLEPDEYLTARTNILKDKTLQDEKTGMLDKVGQFFTGPPADTKQSELRQVDKAGILSGNPQTQAAAKRNIRQAVTGKLGLGAKAKYSKEDWQSIQNELRSTYDVGLEEVFK